MELSFEHHTLDSIDIEKYIEMVTNAFGSFDKTHLPGEIVIMRRGEEDVGFASVYRHNGNTNYLQYIGSCNGDKRYSVFSDMIDYLMQFGHLLGMINRNNKVALMWALRKGFIIIGTRTLSNGEMFVEIIKEVGV